jgi:radical SAM protein with 4Fe4S-binding SPASM domain
MVVQVEPTNKCNLSCNHCFRYDPASKRKLGDMKLNDFERIIGQFNKVFGVSLIGLGESFLNKDISRMIDLLGQKKIEVYLTTNGTIMNDEIISAINRAKDVRIQFSLDAADKQTFKRIRGRDFFDKIIKNIEYFMKEKNSSVFVSLGLVVMKDNLNELNEFIVLAKQLGIRTIHLGDLSGSWLGDNRDELLINNINVLKDTINKAYQVAEQNKIDLKYNQYFYIWKDSSIKTICTFLWQCPYITWDGYVTPCCNLPIPETLNFGNVLEQSFNEIWNSDKYVNFRKLLKRGNPPQLCKTCQHF